jgi:RNA recognition motif-containing protein
VEYDDEKCAEDAIRELNKLNMGGLEIAIQWSKQSGKYDAVNDSRPPR